MITRIQSKDYRSFTVRIKSNESKGKDKYESNSLERIDSIYAKAIVAKGNRSPVVIAINSSTTNKDKVRPKRRLAPDEYDRKVKNQ